LVWFHATGSMWLFSNDVLIFNNILFLKTHSIVCLHIPLVKNTEFSKKCTVEGVSDAYIAYTLSVTDSSFCFLKQNPDIKLVTIIRTLSSQPKNPKASHNLPVSRFNSQQNWDVKPYRNQA
jgi:hypothetical protein